jgi:spermidine/putrescine transport system substrate-binding protein
MPFQNAETVGKPSVDTENRSARCATRAPTLSAESARCQDRCVRRRSRSTVQPDPLDPRPEASLESPHPLLRAGGLASPRRFDRRTFLTGAGAVSAAALLSACSVPGAAVSNYQPVPDTSDADKVVNWSNWSEYIDVEDPSSPGPTTLEEFTKATGITVNYTEDVNDNDSWFAKIQPQLAGGQAIGADVFVVTDWMVAKLIRLGYVVPLDKANIPNATNLLENLQNVSYDPGRKYSLPWQVGITGIADNSEALGGKKITSVDQLLTDPELHGRVTLLTEMQDTVGLTLLDMGHDPNNFTDAQFDAAIAKLQAAVDGGQVRRFTGNEYGPDLAAGNVLACMAWASDIFSLQADNPELEFVIPDAGGMIWSDNFVIPIRSPHKKNAEILMNFYYQPDISAQVEDWVDAISPVQGTDEAMKELDPDLLENPLVFPPADVLAKTHGFMLLTEDQENRCNRLFAKLTGA